MNNRSADAERAPPPQGLYRGGYPKVSGDSADNSRKEAQPAGLNKQRSSRYVNDKVSALFTDYDDNQQPEWYYIDDSQDVQGPYAADKMINWYKKDFL